MIEAHKHCPVCGTPIPLNERACSPDCEKVLIQRERQIKKNRNIMYALLAVFVIVWIYFMFIKK